MGSRQKDTGDMGKVKRWGWGGVTKRSDVIGVGI